MTSNTAKKILIFGGWFGSRNAGDEAILVALEGLLEQAIPGCEIQVHTIDPEYTRRLCNAEPVFAPQDTHLLNKARALAAAYRSVDLFLVSGGTPIFDYYYLSRAFHFGVPLLSGVPMVFFGIGVKPIRTSFGRWFYRNLLNRARYVSVRDPEVRAHLSAMGVTRPTELTADSAICIQPGDAGEAARALAAADLDPERPIVGLCPIYLSDDHRSHYHEPVSPTRREYAYQSLAELADHLLATDRQVAFVPMHQVPPDDDRAVIRGIRGRMRNRAPVLEPREDPRFLTALLGRMDMVVGMRLHSIVLASSQAVPVVAIAFDMKVGSYMDYLSMEKYCQSIQELGRDQLIQMTEDCWLHRARISEQLTEKMGRWRGLVEQSASRLAEIWI
jgi:polysaccharide pyruvyl transferase WcaK-like protein